MKPEYEYELAFTIKEVISALVEEASRRYRLPYGSFYATIEFIKDKDEITQAIVLKANKFDDKNTGKV